MDFDDNNANLIAAASLSLSVILCKRSKSIGYLVRRCKTVGNKSFNCKRRHALCDSALLSNLCRLSSFFRFSLSASSPSC